MTDNTGKSQLDSCMARLDKLDEERDAVAEDTKALRKVFSLRKLEKGQLAMIERYADTAGLFAGLDV